MTEKLNLFDVGARGGVGKRWQPFFDKLAVTGFDADQEECDRLNKKQFPYDANFHPFALGAVDGEEATLNLCKHSGSSSLLKPNLELCNLYPFGKEMEVIRTVPLKLHRMDSVCGDVQPDVIKVDTQGTELDILKGAGSLLDNTLAVDLEVEFVPQYHDQPLFAEIDIFMREKGFTLRSLRRTYWRTKAEKHVHSGGGQIIHGDALYIRNERMNCEKGHLILAAYRQYDLLAHYGQLDLIPNRNVLLRALSAVFGKVPHRFYRRFADQLRRKDAADWHDVDFF